ncbi:MAG: type II toxin-antitoxin system Phd/YefM family antitoxin [Polyangiaceae bacterium]|nr:type II toxin-antitoxin system Phd/YefM family antitoxin [Polyangiaceae bacterium]MCL4756226.1 type II toxin-antitoxin system Phd/YefM family antitoxin [Myxococcales bacterium]
MKKTWALQDAKNRLSELVAEAERSGPQVITRRGQETAVVLSFDEWKRLSRRRGRLIEVLRRAPRFEGGLDTRRSKDPGREVEL